MKWPMVKQTPEFRNCYKKIVSAFGKAIALYNLVSEGDHIAVGLSGGKDSWTLLHLLIDLYYRTPVKFDVSPITVETGFAGFDKNVEKLERYCREVLNKELLIIHDRFPEIIDKHKSPGTSSCSFCARMRRGALYTYLLEHNINKLALGHHADDAIESMLMSQMYNGVLWTQKPIFRAKDKDITVVRPLILVYEEYIIQFGRFFYFPIVTCNCPHEGNVNHKRYVTKYLVKYMSADNPYVRMSLLKACQQLFDIIKDDASSDKDS